MNEPCFMCKQTKPTMAFVKVTGFGEVWACHGCACHIKFELLNKEEDRHKLMDGFLKEKISIVAENMQLDESPVELCDLYSKNDLEEKDGRLLGRGTLPDQGRDEEARGQLELPNL